MIRPMLLARQGWYPHSKDLCKKEIEKFIDDSIFIEGRIPVAGIVPHAGWYYCGQWSINVIKLLKQKNGDIGQIFIFGGHLSKSNLPIIEDFDYAETPFGNLENNKEVVNALTSNFNIQKVDFLPDNTIEIVLPIIKYFFKEVKIVAIYLPPNIKINDMLDFIEKNYSKNSIFIGSTDLTHYGSFYNFFHKDKSIDPVKWVKQINDRGYIELLINMKGEESIEYANNNKSACSAGAAYGSLYIARKKGVTKGELIGYSTSYDIRKDESFVGYTGIIY
ncbi:MAG TPA: AmmeMemoRadiSam system protein B [Spirochaetota bacterium]|nr:AmmeMemoRadiSam system protein B [Spirochaetota bacterium]HOL57998.1 AmmeMemoRadiSam system protein B [Spirochaetota bacterium]HPP04209.1 AmmeMemoRadiSam system protein B [Spirochaetota bacterium]